MSLSNCLVSLLLLFVLFQLVATTPTWYGASDGNSYLIESDPKYNWLQAYDLCGRQELQLAVIDSAAKYGVLDALLHEIFLNSPDLWLGHHDEFNKASNIDRPFYSVATGNELTYGNWYPGEPNNLGNVEHCAHIAADFKWNDRDCKHPTGGYVCEKPQQTIKYNQDLEQKRLSINQKNTQVSSHYKNTQNAIQVALANDQSATNNILLNFDNSLEDIIGESKISLSELIKMKPYLAAVIDDVGEIIKEILEETHMGILRISKETRESINRVQVETESSINDDSDRFAIILAANSNEIDELLSQL